MGAGIGTALIPVSLYQLSPEIQNYAIRIIKEELYYLKLDSSGVHQFVNDYFQARENNLNESLKWKLAYFLKLDWRRSGRISDLIKYYLLSSDFFINKTDESKIVNYLGLFNSYKSPVPNPYSFVIYPPQNRTQNDN